MTTLADLIARHEALTEDYRGASCAAERAYILQEREGVKNQIRAMRRNEEPELALDWDSVKIAAFIMALIVTVMIAAGPR